MSWSEYVISMRRDLRMVNELAERGEFDEAIALLDDLHNQSTRASCLLLAEKARRRALEGMKQ